jgi:serine/threonine-protein kinase
MPLAPGTRLGPYEIVSVLGAGGMGEVYRARDTRLQRDVAIKTLPSIVAADADRLSRFEREARLLASLHHPNIAAVYGLEESGEVRGLVMELVEGQTLADLVQRSPRGLPTAQALAIARQITEALEAAHEHGVVHRDLKPGNIMVSENGTVKVLDFGLAKALGTEFSGGSGLVDSPTATSADTEAGVVLGTAAYMSPEQARGQAVDKRSDIFSFGAVLYETITGRRAFEGDNATDILAAIVTRDPDLTALPAGTPAPVRRLLKRSLEKDKRRRLSDIADAKLDIDEAIAPPASDVAAIAAPARAPWRRWVAAAAAVVGVALGAGGYAWIASGSAAPRSMRFVIAPPSTDPLYSESIGTQVAISPDGQFIVYVGMRGSPQLYVRHVNSLEARVLAGTQGGRQPFFSRDSRSIGYWATAEGEIRRVPVDGGPVGTVCRAPTGNYYGAAWGPDDTIVFGSGNLYRVPAAGGTPQVVAKPDAAQQEAELRWPEILPDGKHVLAVAWGGNTERARVVVLSLADGTRRNLIEGATTPRYSQTGHLIFHQTGTLMAAAFNPTSLELSADRLPLQEPVKTTVSGVADFALSHDGTLVVVPESARPERRLVWVDRKNVSTPFYDVGDDYWLPRLSPDGTRLAVGIGWDIWVIDPARRTRHRVTYGTTSTLFPYSWSADGTRIIFSKIENKVGLDLYSTPADGSGQLQQLLVGEHRQWATSATLDGAIATYEQNPATLRDMWTVTADGKRTPFLTTPYQERGGRYSPDGRWLAYVSNDSGRDEVYVRPAAGGGERHTVSTEGGIEPVWAAGGRELFYRNGDHMMAAPVQTSPALSIGRAQELFVTTHERDRGSGFANANYDVTRDATRFVMIQPPAASSHIVVALHWFEELRARARGVRR